MIYEVLKFSDTDESVVDLHILKIDLKSFNTRWDETIKATKKQPHVGILENIQQQLKPLLSLLQSRYRSKGEPRDDI